MTLSNGDGVGDDDDWDNADGLGGGDDTCTYDKYDCNYVHDDHGDGNNNHDCGCYGGNDDGDDDDGNVDDRGDDDDGNIDHRGGTMGIVVVKF